MSHPGRIIVHVEPDRQILALRCRRQHERAEVSYRVPNLWYALDSVVAWLKSMGELQVFLHEGPGRDEASRHLRSLGVAFQGA